MADSQIDTDARLAAVSRGGSPLTDPERLARWFLPVRGRRERV